MKREGGFIAAILLFGLLGLSILVSAAMINYTAASRAQVEAQRIADEAALEASVKLSGTLSRLAELNLLLKGILASIVALEAGTILTAGAAAPATLKAIEALLKAGRAIAKIQDSLLRIAPAAAIATARTLRREASSLTLFPSIPLYPKEAPTTLELHVHRLPSVHPGLPGFLALESHFKERQFLKISVKKSSPLLAEKSWLPGGQEIELPAVAYSAPVGTDLMTPRWRSALISPRMISPLRSVGGGRVTALLPPLMSGSEREGE